MLCDKLNGQNWKSEYISAEKDQSERLKAISKLKKYKCRILVSTDLTARGIDVENVNLVINMDTPFDAQTYLHRIGRAGRFGTKGIAITLASSGREEEQLHKIIKDCKLKINELKSPIPSDIWKMDDLDEDFYELDKPSNEPKEEDYNPFDCHSMKSDSNDNEFNNGFMSFDEILKEYNRLKSSTKAKTDERPKSANEPNVSAPIDYEKLAKSIKKCYIDDDDCDLMAYPSGDIGSEERVIGESNKNDSLIEVNIENICDETHEYNQIRVNDNESEEQCVQTSNQLYNSNEISGRLSSAMFPSIHSISNPIQYNQWMRRNLHFWLYLANPFQNITKHN